MPPATPSTAAFPSCPVPLAQHATITLGHGGGGRLTQDLLDRIFRPAFANPALDAAHDGAVLEPDLAAGGGRLAFTTDAHVVSPLFFPGGDIGSLAVYGTVNDLAMCGARPLALSAAFILEEGLATDVLVRVVASMRAAAAAAGVPVVTGDTKVVERGKGDGLYVITSGVGLVPPGVDIGPDRVRPGDAILLSGDIGRHGMAILATRENLAFESPIQSDCAPLAAPVRALIDAGLHPRCLRDLTRGGLATALIELAETGGFDCSIDEDIIPVGEAVHGACEILGFDPLYVANEGRFVAFVPPEEAEAALAVLARTVPDGPPVRIGIAAERRGERGRVFLRSLIGAERRLDRLSGEQLPRIC